MTKMEEGIETKKQRSEITIEPVIETGIKARFGAGY